jgi:hypothetical protein
MRARLARAGIAHNDYVVGIENTGGMDETAVLQALARLPAGVGELYCHPAEAGDAPLTPSMRDYRHSDELDALLSPRVAHALAGVMRGGFMDVCGTADARFREGMESRGGRR